MAVMAAKKRPCRECGLWFSPNMRVGNRQRTCSRTECQVARRVKTQAAWRERHPDYELGRQIQERSTAAAAGETAAPSRVTRPLDRLPWDLAQDQFKAQGTEFLKGMGRVLCRNTQDQISAQDTGTTG